MRRSGTLPFAITLAALSIAGTARAHSEYVQYIPNGNVHQCANCHPNGNELALNIFGQDSLAQTAKPVEQWWPALIPLDSDGDGQTNAQELGDPCGEWLIGLTPGRTTDIANPGDATSLALNPDVPSCEPTGSGGGTTGSGPTTTTTGNNGGGGSGGSSGGQGGEVKSTGAGKADDPISTTPGSCAMTPSSPDPAGSLAVLAAVALLLSRRSSRGTSRANIQ